MRAIMRTACGCEKEFVVPDPPPHYIALLPKPRYGGPILHEASEPIEPNTRRFEFAGYDHLRAVYLEVP